MAQHEKGLKRALLPLLRRKTDKFLHDALKMSNKERTFLENDVITGLDNLTKDLKWDYLIQVYSENFFFFLRHQKYLLCNQPIHQSKFIFSNFSLSNHEIYFLFCLLNFQMFFFCVFKFMAACREVQKNPIYFYLKQIGQHWKKCNQDLKI